MIIRVVLTVVTYSGLESESTNIPYGYVDVRVKGEKDIHEAIDLALSLVSTTFYERDGMTKATQVISASFEDGPVEWCIIAGDYEAVMHNPVGKRGKN